MVQTIVTVDKPANADAVIPLPVGKKLYGAVGLNSKNIDIEIDGKTFRILSNTGATREIWYPVPLEFEAAAKIIFNGSGIAGTCGIIIDA